MATLNPNTDYELLINGSPVKVSTELNLKSVGEVHSVSVRLSENLEGSITCQMSNDDFGIWQHKMHEYQKRTGKPRMCYIPDSFFWEKTELHS